MCSYTYQKARNPLDGRVCIYPEFYREHTDIHFAGEPLPLDDSGLCLFHSRDILWKNEKGFNRHFAELKRVLTSVNQDKVSFHRTYNFSGFYFCDLDSEPLVIDDSGQTNPFDFSNCTFRHGLRLKGLAGFSAGFAGSIFDGDLVARSVHFIDANFTDCIFENGAQIIDSSFDGHTYFERCHFKEKDGGTQTEFKISSKGTPGTSNYINFSKSVFDTTVIIKNTAFLKEVNFDSCVFNSEVIFDQLTLRDQMSFRYASFLLDASVNPMYGSLHFEKLLIETNGKLLFVGDRPMADMVRGELTLGIEPESTGSVHFENFNLNRIYGPDKQLLFELEKKQLVEIGKGCRKYYCQTEIFIAKSSRDNQNMILDFVNVFCNYFGRQEGSNLGIEIVKRTDTEIQYFYFTDEEIGGDEFYRRIRKNEQDIWIALSRLTELAQEAIGNNDLQLLDCLIKLNGWWKMLGYRVSRSLIDREGLTEIVNSVSLGKWDQESVIGMFTETNKRFNAALENPKDYINTIVISPVVMGNNYNFSGGTYNQSQIGDGGVQHNHGSPQMLKEMLLEILHAEKLDDATQDELLKGAELVANEPSGPKRDSKWGDFIKEWAPTLTDGVLRAIRELVLKGA